jgi:serine/threonine protein phosphatase PrpC
MRLLSSKPSSRLDEAALLAALDLAAAEPAARRSERWRASHEQAARLLDTLSLYREHRILLRGRQDDPPIYRPDLAASIDASPDAVVLIAPDGRSRRLQVPDLLDANVCFAELAGLERSWQVRPAHEWSDWDRAVAWAEEVHDPHGAGFDLPPAWRGLSDHTLPLFGWRLDRAAGVSVRHDVAVITLRHTVGPSVRHVPLFDVSKCFRRGQSPAERIRSRPVRLPGGWDQGWIRSVALAERRVVIDRVPRERDGGREVVELGVDALLAVNEDLGPLIEALASHELTELRRRLEAHRVAGGLWVASPALRVTLQRAHLPLTGWSLGEQAFAGLARGEVRFSHRHDAEPLVVSARQASEMMRDEVPPAERLFDDPCTAPNGAPAFLRSVDPHGCWLTPTSDEPSEAAHCVPHAVWVRSNPELADALLRCVPDLGQHSLDPTLRATLRELWQRGEAELEPWAEALASEAPVLHHPLAVQVAAELLERGSTDLPARWEDHTGAWWRWVGTTAGGFLFRADGRGRGPKLLSGPDAGAWAGQWLSDAPPPGALRLLTPEQLPFASVALTRRVHEWQLNSGLIQGDGAVADLPLRVARIMARTQQTLSELCARWREHLQMSKELHEDPTKARAMRRHLDRLRSNLQEISAGRGMYAWFEEERRGRLGMGLAAGGATSALRPACDDRLRLTESIQTRCLGRFRLASVGGGGGFGEEATGPAVWALLDDIENRVAGVLHDTAELGQIQAQVVEAICAASHAAGHAEPICSFVALLTHLDSGASWVFWCGNARLWRYRRSVNELRALTFDHSFEGLLALGVDAGLSPEDALDAVLHLTLGRRSRREVEAVREEDRLRVAERFRTEAARRAVRAGLGGSRERMEVQHGRLTELLDTYAASYERRLDLSAIKQGSAMVFARELRVREGERFVLATAGLSALAARRPLWVQRALDLPDPQRTVEWLVEGMEQLEGEADDLALIALDPEPTRPYRSDWSRRDGHLLRRTVDQSALLAGGVVPPLREGAQPALRLDPRRLARWYGEVDDLIRRGKIPDPERKPVPFAVAVAKWASERPGSRERAAHAEQGLRALHDVLEERNDDPLDETLLVLFLLRKRNLVARYVHGLRVEGEASAAQVSEACWIELDVGGAAWVIDVPRADQHGALPRATAYAAGAIAVEGGLLGMRRRELQLRYVPRHPVYVELPAELPGDSDPFVRLDLLTRAALPSLTPLPLSPISEPAYGPDDEPTVEIAPKTAEGFLDLDG